MVEEFSLQKAHGYVIVVALATMIVIRWAAYRVARARKVYGIHYPQMYAEKSDLHHNEFNCIQRAHQNMLENLSEFYVILFTASLYRPLWGTLAGVIRLLGFIVYVLGYSTGDPDKRQYGAIGYVGLTLALGLTIEAIIKISL